MAKKNHSFFRADLAFKNINHINVEQKKTNLSLNEAPFNPLKLLSGSDLNDIVKFGINRYPLPSLEEEVKAKLSAYNHDLVKPHNLLCGNGIDDLLYLLFLSVNEPKSKILISTPTYPDYKNYALSVGLGVEEVPLLEDFQLDIPGILKKAKDRNIKMVILCNPNNPTGNLIQSSDIYYLLEKITDKMILVDEAYYEFSKQSCISTINQYPQLVITRSFSKGFFSSGLRFGYLISQSSNISELLKIKSVYNLSSLTQYIVLKFLDNPDKFNSRIDYLIKLRDIISRRLALIPGLKVYDSHTNFLLFRLPEGEDPRELYDYLLGNGIAVRNVSKNIPSCLRVSIGEKAEMDEFARQVELYFHEKVNRPAEK